LNDDGVSGGSEVEEGAAVALSDEGCIGSGVDECDGWGLVVVRGRYRVASK
jgi:hypothetical protein